MSDYGTLSPMRIKQVGAHNQCGKQGCTVRNPWWRVGLGEFDVQVYACSAHLSWAVALDMLGWDEASSMGWQKTTGTIEYPWVSPNISAIEPTDFGRTPDVSAQYPQATMRDGRVCSSYHNE